MRTSAYVVEPQYFSVHQAAVYLGISEKAVYKWVTIGQIPAYKLGRLWRFDKSELDQFVRGLARHTV